MRVRFGLIASSLTLLMSWSFIPLPGPDLVRQLAVLLPLIGFTLLEFTRPGRWRVSEVRVWVLVAFASLVAFGVLRAVQAESGGMSVQTALPQVATMVAVLAFGLVIFARDSGSRSESSDLIALAFAPGVLVAANLLLWMAGIGAGASNGLTDTPAGMLAAAGVHVARTTFPLTVGWNQMGVVGAAAACVAVMLASDSDRRIKWAAGVVAALALVVMLLSDSRGAMIALIVALVVTLGLVLAGRRSAGFKVLVPVVVTLFVATSFVLADTIVPVAKAAFPSLLDIREDGEDSPRAVMRASVIDALSQSRATALIGWGEYGQVPSGAFAVYGALFASPGLISEAGDHIWTTHNLALQTLVDIGVIGLFFLCLLFAGTLSGLASQARKPGGADHAMFAMVMVLALSSVTEASPSLYQPATFWLLLLVACAGARATGAKVRQTP